MIDPLVSLLMPAEEQATQNDISHYIQVEEAIDCRNSNKRFFSLLNRESSLNVIISEQATITSCKLDQHEIVVHPSLYEETHETWAIGERPYQKLSNLLWNSHVRGSELVLSSSSSLTNNIIGSNNNNGNSNISPHTTLYFELTRSNELDCMGKLKSIHMQHQVYYFNLNRGPSQQAPSVTGHKLSVKCNGSLESIQVQPTKLLCRCNKTSPATSQLAQYLISDIPCELTQQIVNTSPDLESPDDFILTDAIYSFESTQPQDFLQARLECHDRVLLFQVRAIQQSAPSNQTATSGSTSTAPATGGSNNCSSGNNSSGNSNVTSSTNRSKSRQGASDNIDLMQQQVAATDQDGQQRQREQGSQGQQSCSIRQSDDSIASSSSQSPVVKLEPQESAPVGGPSSSSEIKYKFANNNAKVAPQAASSTHHSSTMLRLRIRVTNFGVCILPHMMTNYACSYKFTW